MRRRVTKEPETRVYRAGDAPKRRAWERDLLAMVQEIARRLAGVTDLQEAARMVMGQVKLLEAGTYLRAVVVEDERVPACGVCDQPFANDQATVQNAGEAVIHAACLDGASAAPVLD